ncbi:MAG TPA: hypothetical protein VF940_30215 [Streptosporangiaceae bacterium]
MTSWHVDEMALRRWIGRSDSLADSASVEQHLLWCDQCRERVNAAVTGRPAPGVVDLGDMWSQIRDAVELPRSSVFERLLQRAGLPAHDAKLVAVASAFRGKWLAGVTGVLTFVALAAALGDSRGVWLFLAVAPLVPCIAVAFSYDPKVDPALEPELVTPYPALRLVLLRTVAILGMALPAVALFGLFVPGRAPYTWLLPAVGCVAAVLALSTWTSSLRAAVAVSAVWLVVVWSLVAQAGSPDVVLHARFQIGYLVLAVTSTVIFLVRGRHVREFRPRRR